MTVWMVNIHFNLKDTTAIMSINNLKCGLIGPSQISLGSVSQKRFSKFCIYDFWFAWHSLNLALVVATKYHYQQWFSEVFPMFPYCINAVYTVMLFLLMQCCLRDWRLQAFRVGILALCTEVSLDYLIIIKKYLK